MIRRIVALAALVLAAAPAARAETTRPQSSGGASPNAVSVGFGVGIEPLGLLGLSPNASPLAGNSLATPGADFYVPIQIGSQLRIEPSVGFRHDGNSANSSNAFRLGVGGLFYLSPPTPVAFYVGGRLGLAYYSFTPTGGTTDSATDFSIAPVLGAEYAFATRFTLGAEAQLPITWYGNPAGSRRDADSVSTNVVVFLRYFFM